MNKRPLDEHENPSKKAKTASSDIKADLSDIQKKIKEKQEALAKIQAAKQKAAEREQTRLAEKALHSTIQEVHDEQVKAKGGLNVAYHPALSMVLDPKARLSKNRNEMLIPKANFSTVKANQNLAASMPAQPRLVKKKEIKVDEPVPFEDPTKNPYFDTSLKTTAAIAPQKRNRSTFKFVAPGKYIDQAKELRKQEELERLKQEIAERARKSGLEKELELVANAGLRMDPPPNVEWWDAKLVPNESYDDFDIHHGALDELINNIVQHPVPIEPPAEEGKVEIKPLLLTDKERKKLRRQNRLEAQREKQDKIRLGLLPQEQPRITKSNFMRVLGQEAILAPSMVEKEMARQVAERQQKHKELTESQKLTDEEKRQKKDRKLREDTSVLSKVAVFRVTNLEHKQHLYKININAQQFKLTGVGIINQGMNLVVVEGGPKGIAAYKKLMLNRINWQDRPEGAEPFVEPNECLLVWEGEVKNKSFFNFRLKTLESNAQVKTFLEEKQISHYWNAARTFMTDITV